MSFGYPGELWECIEPEKACATPTVEAYTLNWTSSFYRLKKPFILLEAISNEDDELCAWKVMTERGPMFVQGGLQYFARKVENAAG
jgi:hypothetical protein